MVLINRCRPLPCPCPPCAPARICKSASWIASRALCVLSGWRKSRGATQGVPKLYVPPREKRDSLERPVRLCLDRPAVWLAKDMAHLLRRRCALGQGSRLSFFGFRQPVPVQLSAKARLHHLPVQPKRTPSAVAELKAHRLSALPAAVLARILLSCDLTGLCCLVATAPLFCLGSAEVGEAMPLPLEKIPDRWLSFARASLLWADLLACLHLGSAKVAQRSQSVGRQGRASSNAPSALGTPWVTSSTAATTCFSTDALVTLTSEASCAITCPDAPGLLATGHQGGIRLWGRPDLTKLGIIRTRSPVVALDLGKAGDLLAAIQAVSPALLCMWDLTSEIAGPSLPTPLWSANVASTSMLNFLGESILVCSVKGGVDMLNAADGSQQQFIEIPGHPQASCRCTEPREWWCQGTRTSRTCVLVAVDCRAFAISERGASTDVQGSEILEFVEPQEACAPLVSLGASSTMVASVTSDGRVLVWKVVDRTLLGIFPTFSVLDFENLSWSVGQAETVYPSQITQMLVLEEVLAQT